MRRGTLSKYKIAEGSSITSAGRSSGINNQPDVYREMSTLLMTSSGRDSLKHWL